jgi:hypothetical protein
MASVNKYTTSLDMKICIEIRLNNDGLGRSTRIFMSNANIFTIDC